MEQVPESMIAAGDSSGCELGQGISQFGAQVMIVEMEDHIRSNEESEASQLAEEAFAAEGIGVRTGAWVEGAASRQGSIVATLADGEELSASGCSWIRAGGTT